MSKCGIFRVAKLTAGNISGLEREHNRTEADRGKYERGEVFKASDIDFNRTADNISLVRGDRWEHTANEQIKEAGCKRVRKDSIRVIDALYTASAEAMEEMSFDEQMSFFKDCLLWHCKYLCDGNSENLINAVIHFDEAVVHMHVSSVPIVENSDGSRSLSAKKILGDGNKRYFHELQEKFFEEVSSRYGLERGEVKETALEKREHLSVQDFKKVQRAAEVSALDRDIDQAKDRLDYMREEIQQGEKLIQQQRDEIDKMLSSLTDQKGIKEIEARTRERRGFRVRSIADDDTILKAARAAAVSAERLETVRRNRDDLNVICHNLSDRLERAQQRAERAEIWKDITQGELLELSRKFEKNSAPQREILRIAGIEDTARPQKDKRVKEER